MSVGQLYATQQGMKDALNLFKGDLTYIGLFQNNMPMTRGWDPAGMVEADFSGYARIDVSLDWAAPTINANGNAQVTNILRSWVKSGAIANAAIYGYFFADPSGNVVAGQTFAEGSFPMVIDGDIIRITPKWEDGTPLFPEPS